MFVGLSSEVWKVNLHEPFYFCVGEQGICLLVFRYGLARCEVFMHVCVLSYSIIIVLTGLFMVVLSNLNSFWF